MCSRGGRGAWLRCGCRCGASARCGLRLAAALALDVAGGGPFGDDGGVAFEEVVHEGGGGGGDVRGVGFPKAVMLSKQLCGRVRGCSSVKFFVSWWRWREIRQGEIRRKQKHSGARTGNLTARTLHADADTLHTGRDTAHAGRRNAHLGADAAPLPRMRGRGSLRGMNALTDIDPKDLRPLLHAEIDKLRDEDLALAHRALLEIELRRLADKLGADFDEDWASGKLTKANIQEAILDHRRKHPYR